MRLINIDDEGLKKTMAVGGISAKALWKRLQREPTVKAIPVEWIKKQIEKYATFEFHLDVDDIEARACLEYLLEDWRKENEEDGNPFGNCDFHFTYPRFA